MFKKTLLAASVGVAMAAATIPAHAFTITAGSYKMIVDAYTNGTIYGASCNSVASCDGAAAVGAVGAVGSEDTWGILSIASITNTTTNTQMFTRGPDGYLIGSVTGLVDNNVQDFGPFQNEYATGGVISLYLSAANFDPTISTASQANVLNQFSALPLYLQLAFVLGVDGTAEGLAASYQGNFNSNTGVAGGSGFLSVTGGSAAANFDTDYFTTWTGATADAFFTVTGKPPLSGDAGFNNWLLNDSLDVQGQTVPEPGSLALLGLGFAGLAALRRRKTA